MCSRADLLTTHRIGIDRLLRQRLALFEGQTLQTGQRQALAQQALAQALLHHSAT